MIRVPSIGTDPAFVSMIRELIAERQTANPERRVLGSLGPSHDICPINCCQLGERRPRTDAGGNYSMHAHAWSAFGQ